METKSEQATKKFKVGDILVNERYKQVKYPPKYFKCVIVDKAWGVVGYTTPEKTETIGFAHVRKANWIEKLIWYLKK